MCGRKSVSSAGINSLFVSLKFCFHIKTFRIKTPKSEKVVVCHTAQYTIMPTLTLLISIYNGIGCRARRWFVLNCEI